MYKMYITVLHLANFEETAITEPCGFRGTGGWGATFRPPGAFAADAVVAVVAAAVGGDVECQGSRLNASGGNMASTMGAFGSQWKSSDRRVPPSAVLARKKLTKNGSG